MSLSLCICYADLKLHVSLWDFALNCFVVFSSMASKYGRTAYVYCVPVGTSESALRSMLNNGNQSDYSIHVNEMKQGAASVTVFGSGLYYAICCPICMNFSEMILLM